ncbi:adenylate kinase [Bacteroidia bacterium]|jgi:adenylate kinase|uniref:Adenylate kinase n=1 Tax=uncultured Flavobacteriia bacterium TaxID=212695 RepID=H6RIJ4_9BACT|nr:adenylate kinase [uncultured bacterium]MDC0105804.1 adenylate kinase [Bacteroidia bacterium]MDC1430930.1 adenylate kinase [Bacteroidia bacterium]CCG00935.1 Adenylate kinase (ATP-AMP transphosphorylase) (AK) [uncultured Flavobacteriia bacterium]|tara:strand:+ start:11236 stop:11814 length:579 start_codon:yes stop_codon:yes gene_type:complete
MLNIILFGPPGAGKGTQSAKLIDKYELTHLSTGDVFRYNIKNETELGVLAKSFIDKGELVPDEVTNNMVKDFLVRNANEKGFIFDGYPRTIAQGENLDIVLTEMDTSVTMMLALEVDEDELVKRLLERGETSGRVDDQNEDTIRNRFKVYQEETSPLAQFYSDQGKYTGVYGMGVVDDIFYRLCKAIEAKLP